MSTVVKTKALFRDYAEAKAFGSLFNIWGAVNDHVFLTKSGGLLAVIKYHGIDPECAERELVESITSTCQSALRAFDERFVVNSWLLKRSRPEIEVGSSSSGVAMEALKNRHALLEGKAESLYSFEAYLTVLIKPDSTSPRIVDRLAAFGRNPLDTLRPWFSTTRRSRILDSELNRSLRLLHQAIQSFLEQTADSLDAQLLTKNDAFCFFRRLTNPDPAKAIAVPLVDDTHVDYFVVDSVLECFRDHLRLDNRFVKSLTLKRLPSRTFAHMLSDLARVRSDLYIHTEWSVNDPMKALSDVRSKRRHAHNTKVSLFSQVGSERPYERELLFDESKEAVVADLGECLKAVEMRSVRLGGFSLTVVIIADLLEEAERAAAEVMKVIGRHEGALNEERYNGLNAFLATLPGGYPYNLRKLIVTNENHADMVPWFQPAAGERRNEFLGTGCLAAFETEDRSLFHFNLHVQDVGHALLLGPTGSGKSFLLNFLATHAQQYEPYTFIFDVGGGFRWLTELFGGSYVPFRPNLRTFSINPFCLEPTTENFEFQFSFVKLLIESGEYRMSDTEERELFEAIRSLYVLPRDQRRLSSLYAMLRRTTGEHLRRWTEGEQHGDWFDNVEDNVSFARFQCIDFEGMERLGPVLEPLLFYLLHRANEFIYNPALSDVLKIAIVDEAWLFFKHPVTRAYIATALRTWRKKNAAMILSTQSLQDLSGAELFRPLIESCPTKLLLANPTLDATFYSEVLRLNSVEVEKIRQLSPKRQFLLKRDRLSKVLNLNVDPKSYWLFTANPYEAKRRQELVNEVGLEAALNILSGGSK